MTLSGTRRVIGTLALACGVAAVAVPGRVMAQNTPPSVAQGEAAAMARARTDSLRRPYTKADIDFMTGMIGHHAQAIIMARWAATHGAGPQIRVLTGRIINAQKDEIRTMQTWLRDRSQPVPEPDTTGMGMMDPHMMMPGMLSHEQMMQLDAAHGPDFDKLFLHFMIQHHQGATAMVSALFDTYGAAQDELTFKLASDINADQTTEIARMQKMLVAATFGITPEDTAAGQ